MLKTINKMTEEIMEVTKEAVIANRKIQKLRSEEKVRRKTRKQKKSEKSEENKRNGKSKDEKFKYKTLEDDKKETKTRI